MFSHKPTGRSKTTPDRVSVGWIGNPFTAKLHRPVDFQDQIGPKFVDLIHHLGGLSSFGVGIRTVRASGQFLRTLLLTLAFQLAINGLNAPAEVGSLCGVGALFQGNLEFPPGVAVAVDVPVAASQCQWGNGGASFAGADEELDCPVVHAAERVPLS